MLEVRRCVVEAGAILVGGAVVTCFFHGKAKMTWEGVTLVLTRATFAVIGTMLAMEANERDIKRGKEITVFRASDGSLMGCQNAGVCLSLCVIVGIAAKYFPKWLGAPTEAVAGFLGSSVGMLAGAYMTRNWYDDC